MPRPRKPTSVLKLTGTYQKTKSRYASRDTEVQGVGAPEPPESLNGDALDWWRRNVPNLYEIGCVKSSDSDALTECARCWAELQACHRKRPRSKQDKAAKMRERLALSKDFRDWCARFGLTPADRTRVQADLPKKDKSKEFLA